MKKERRRAVHCEMVEPSKTSPGYVKYRITIREVDGTEHIVPAYGKDLQDAIERLLWTERVETVMDKKLTTPIFVVLGLLIVGLSGYLSVKENTPLWLLLSIGTVGLTALLVNRIEAYLKK
jgi:hypothetical protein